MFFAATSVDVEQHGTICVCKKNIFKKMFLKLFLFRLCHGDRVAIRAEYFNWFDRTAQKKTAREKNLILEFSESTLWNCSAA